MQPDRDQPSGNQTPDPISPETLGQWDTSTIGHQAASPYQQRNHLRSRLDANEYLSLAYVQWISLRVKDHACSATDPATTCCKSSYISADLLLLAPDQRPVRLVHLEAKGNVEINESNFS